LINKYGVALLATLTLFLLPAGSALAADAYLSPTGSDTNPCTSASRCLSMNRGYQVATPGSTVYMASGTYTASQVIVANASKAGNTSDVTFQPEGACLSVVLSSVNSLLLGSNGTQTGPHDVTFSCLELQGFFNTTGKDEANVTLNNISADAIQVQGTQGFTMTGGSVDGGGAGRVSSIDVGTVNGVFPTSPTDVLVSGVTFTNTGTSTTTDCLSVGAAVNFTLERSKFSDCGRSDLVSSAPASDPNPVTGTVRIQSNLFFPGRNSLGKAVSWATQGTDTKVWYNSGPAKDWDFPAGTTTFSNFKVLGNILQLGGCSTVNSNAVFARNWYTTAQTPSTCGANEVNNTNWTNYLSASDYSVVSYGSPSINPLGVVDDFPALDYPGCSKAEGHAPGTTAYPDTGAYEFPDSCVPACRVNGFASSSHDQLINGDVVTARESVTIVPFGNVTSVDYYQDGTLFDTSYGTGGDWSVTPYDALFDGSTHDLVAVAHCADSSSSTNSVSVLWDQF
jgi:hypothetical protein